MNTSPMDDDSMEHQPSTNAPEVETTDFKVPTQENVLGLFSKAQNSEWSLYYNIDILAKEAEERAKNSKPLLTSSLKNKLAERRQRMSLIKKNGATSSTNSSTSITTGAVHNGVDDTAITSSTISSSSTSTSIDINNVEEDSSDEEVSIESAPYPFNAVPAADPQASVDSNEDSNESTTSFDTPQEFIQMDESIVTIVPWVKRKYQGPPAMRLHQELVDFFEFMKETPEERSCRQVLYEYVSTLCKRVDSACVVEIFGSYPSDLMIPGSDLDIHVKSMSINFLMKLQKLLYNEETASDIVFVRNARVPIIKFVDKRTGQHVDISCNNGNDVNVAVRTVNKFIRDYPAFKHLCLFLKYLLRQRGLNEVFSGGLSSFGVSLMLISHLQMHSSNFNPEEGKLTTLGTLLLDFLALYGIYFNYQTVGIDVRRGGLYFPLAKYRNFPGENKQQPAILKLSIVDPNDSSNNITKGTSNLIAIRHCFQHAFQALTASDSQFDDEMYEHSLLARIVDVTLDDIKRRVFIHKDVAYQQYCEKKGLKILKRQKRTERKQQQQQQQYTAAYKKTQTYGKRKRDYDDDDERPNKRNR
jgi:non-canonical poly(A) RNA polymerase PAPD5/7